MPYSDYLFGSDYIKYGGYDPKTFNLYETLNFFYKRYVEPLSNLIDIGNARLLDCACGYGWFTFSFLLAGGSRNIDQPVICMDLDSSRGEIVYEFAKILSLDNKISFIPGNIANLPFGDKNFDIFTCIETLEHLPKESRKDALKEISRVSHYQLITTPNKLWPIDYHDRKVPFAHWFDGRFLTQLEILKGLNSELLSNVYCFEEWIDLEKIYPLYWPYPGTYKTLDKFSLLPFKFLSKINKKFPQYLLPQIQGIYKAK